MKPVLRIYIAFSLIMLLAALLLGTFASWAFLSPETYKTVAPFQQLRPMHVSAALFWIISGASCCALYFGNVEFGVLDKYPTRVKAFVFTWITTIIIVFVFYSLQQYGGREYWEFPPLLSIPLLASWLMLMSAYVKPWLMIVDKKPLYLVMWATGILFFLITFIEQNLWHIEWFRQSYLREVTVQWKANGSMVGAWNQMIYGTSLYLMVKISGDKSIAQKHSVYYFYFLSLSNLMFNWGHHIYNVPTAGWVRHVSYAISMTEWLFFISMIRSFRKKLQERRKLKHLVTYRFIIASELWLFLNLALAILMSIPAINRYTHGTHITVAHAMGTTIGINSMILLGAIGYVLGIENTGNRVKKVVNISYYSVQSALLVFWLSLVVAGLLKGYRNIVLQVENFNEMMRPVLQVLTVFSLAGLFVVAGIAAITCMFLYLLFSRHKKQAHK